MNITELKGVGDKTASLFHKIGIETTSDLIHYYPRDYEAIEAPVNPDDNYIDSVVAIKGFIRGTVASKHVRSLSITSFSFVCESTVVSITYFNMPYLKKSLKQDAEYVLRGVLQKKGNRYTMDQPKIYKPDEYHKIAGHLVPIYPTTKGLTNNTISKSIKQLENIIKNTEDFMPADILKRHDLAPLGYSLMQMHFPSSMAELIDARKRLVFDEFFLFILMLRKMREHNEQSVNQYPMIEVAHTSRLIEALPYQLTSAQQKVWNEIINDLTSDHIMNRLIQGDVGSGKTILAFLSILMCAGNGYQSALMAPTEVLAKQHFENLTTLIKQYDLPLTPVLLTGSTGQKDRKQIYNDIESGNCNVIIGTHALIQDKVNYHNLALVVTDEQHRFGVKQRENLASKGTDVHVLVMSATPIPRTLAIILYGDLSISVLDELPANRLPIKNCVVGTSYRQKAYSFIEKEVAAGHQVYVICPMVEESESMDLENVLDYTETLKSTLSPSIQIAYLHGKMKPAQKNKIMEDFAAKNIDVLVSTTVIEVGINVPNATVMLVENAERFGLAQLHQLRGRVGRGKDQSFCIFITKSEKPETVKRLKILNESNDGFYIASQDLQLRGPGDLFGIRQSGDLRFALGDIYQDAGILQIASEEAQNLYEIDAELQHNENKLLSNHLSSSKINQVDFRTI